jgi:nitronate monooxygenase
MWKKTKLTDQLNLAFPIIQAPMAGGATTPELAAAVSNAGGLGSLGAGYMSPAEIRQAIKKIRELTHAPFAVNLFIPEKHHVTSTQMQKACDDINQSCRELNIKIVPINPPYAENFDDQMQVVIEEKIPVFSYTFGLLDSKWIFQLRQNHTLLIGTATTLSEAKALETSGGVDLIVAQGSEAGGHRGTFLEMPEHALIGLMSLIPQLVDRITVPVIAAGGVMDGRGIVAALTLGASGVQMGTAFLSCHESGVPEIYKQTLLDQTQDHTQLTRAFSGRLARGIRNKFIEDFNKKDVTILDYPIQNALTAKMRVAAKAQNNIHFMSLWAGQSAFACRNIGAAELVGSLVKEVEACYDQTDF